MPVTHTQTAMGLNNVACAVNDKDKHKVWAAFEEMGFTLYPVGRQRGPGPDGDLTQHGTGSRTANFHRGGYFECVSIEDRNQYDNGYAEKIEKGGTHLTKIQITVPDAEAEAASLRELGHDVVGPRYFERRFTGADGEPATAQFRLFRYPPSMTDGLQVVGAQHLNPDTTWQEPWLDHPNGALALTGVYIETPDPVQSASQWGRLFRRPTEHGSGGTASVILPGPATLRFLASRSDRPVAITAVEFGFEEGRPVADPRHLGPGNPARDLSWFSVRAKIIKL